MTDIDHKALTAEIKRLQQENQRKQASEIEASNRLIAERMASDALAIQKQCLHAAHLGCNTILADATISDALLRYLNQRCNLALTQVQNSRTYEFCAL